MNKTEYDEKDIALWFYSIQSDETKDIIRKTYSEKIIQSNKPISSSSGLPMYDG